MKKMTKKEYFALAKSIVEASGHEQAEEIMEFFDHEVELLSRKSSGERKPTATQKLNETLKTAIAESMEPNRLYTVSEVIKEVPACAGLTPQKVSPLMRQLEESGIVEKTKEKGKTLFRIV